MEDKPRQEKSPRVFLRLSILTALLARVRTLLPLLSTAAGSAPWCSRSCTILRWSHSAAKRRAVLPSTFLASRLTLGWSRRRATTPSRPHPAASISGVQPSPSWALGSRPWASRSLVRLRLPSRLALRSWVWHRANGTILVREDYLLPISNLLYSVLDPSYSIPHGHG